MSKVVQPNSEYMNLSMDDSTVNSIIAKFSILEETEKSNMN